MPKHNQRVKGCDAPDGDDFLIVLNAVKRSVDYASLVKQQHRDYKDQVHDALKKVARKAYQLLRVDGGTSTPVDVLHALAHLQIQSQRLGLPSQIGTKRAREIFEIVVGDLSMLEPGIDYVTHHEKPAPYRGYSAPEQDKNCDIDCHADRLEQSDDEPEAGTDAPSLQGTSVPSPIYLLEFKRSPKEFYSALQESPVLQPLRDALQAERLSSLIPGGAWIFVHPDQYNSVRSIAAEWKLKPRHVIIAAEHEPDLMEALQDIGRGVVQKDRKILPPAPMIVRRTFLEIPVQSSLRSEPLTRAVASTTDANDRAKHRPRKA
eukprot:TRINITY_DN108009_c0_g1_i1.p1 TRINITY_DN108009_c0_g1~~TRINITY_DN108009_c0_g1_i1.p1  ORF type:complete len:335 (+),score=53.98 TRINITY_DN108009_c0_g1_i1:51-1007(+)